ncbi:hypothetical protein COV11_00515 [Candidatus Woesearchaeota archaeon CG10_big_fil_rev_8_21_14_0_10_30_7]|nr:MAG: hypothetical protein COV11_00515 [Candidatus Woesearchaeota archaeon CG10_big_fil_rev_8_21_14_0_10_30_7]
MIITKDESVTLYNKHFEETYHSTSGAITEAFEKFVNPALKYVNKKELKILDFCFGLGYNTAALLEKLSENTNFSEVQVLIIGLENDKSIFSKLQNLNPKLKYYDYVKKLNKKLSIKNNFFEIKIMLGNAAEIIKDLKDKFDIVFFDPFSPKKCPELWIEEVFKNVYKKMNIGGVLTTYSCARTVRENMKLAGFKIIDGPIIGRRGPATIALKK